MLRFNNHSFFFISFILIACSISSIIHLTVSSPSYGVEANSYPYSTYISSNKATIRSSLSNSYDDDDTSLVGGYYTNEDDLEFEAAVDSDVSYSLFATAAAVNVENFRSQSNGNDDTQMFIKAWNKACNSVNGMLVVPRGKIYTLKPVTLSGPCRSRTTVQIYGTIHASDNMADYNNNRREWMVYQNVNNLIVLGGGTIDGKGKIWWENSCKTDKSKPCLGAPTALTFYGIRNLRVTDIRVQNAQQMHVVIQKCVNVRTDNVQISSPGDSPNTDGIHITASMNVRLQRSHIGTGDDCISIVSGSKNVFATDTVCGPGHGISIGSLGEGNSGARVSNIFINRATLSDTMNGVRIKSWQGGYGFANNIMFQNVVMRNVSNPIIIDQNYCDQDTPCKKQKSAVEVNKIHYTNIRGTSNTDVAIKFDCSDTYPCKGVLLKDVTLVPQDGGGKAKADCRNVGLTKMGKVTPKC